MIQILLVFLYKIIEIVAMLLSYALIIHVILSWFAQGRSTFGMYLEQIVQPLIRPFKWARIGMFDLSIIVVFLILDYGVYWILGILSSFIQTV